MLTVRDTHREWARARERERATIQIGFTLFNTPRLRSLLGSRSSLRAAVVIVVVASAAASMQFVRLRVPCVLTAV